MSTTESWCAIGLVLICGANAAADDRRREDSELTILLQTNVRNADASFETRYVESMRASIEEYFGRLGGECIVVTRAKKKAAAREVKSKYLLEISEDLAISTEKAVRMGAKGEVRELPTGRSLGPGRATGWSATAHLGGRASYLLSERKGGGYRRVDKWSEPVCFTAHGSAEVITTGKALPPPSKMPSPEDAVKDAVERLRLSRYEFDRAAFARRFLPVQLLRVYEDKELCRAAAGRSSRGSRNSSSLETNAVAELTVSNRLPWPVQRLEIVANWATVGPWDVALFGNNSRRVKRDVQFAHEVNATLNSAILPGEKRTVTSPVVTQIHTEYRTPRDLNIRCYFSIVPEVDQARSRAESRREGVRRPERLPHSRRGRRP